MYYRNNEKFINHLKLTIMNKLILTNSGQVKTSKEVRAWKKQMLAAMKQAGKDMRKENLEVIYSLWYEPGKYIFSIH